RAKFLEHRARAAAPEVALDAREHLEARRQIALAALAPAPGHQLELRARGRCDRADAKRRVSASELAGGRQLAQRPDPEQRLRIAGAERLERLDLVDQRP